MIQLKTANDFNPRAPRGARLIERVNYCCLINISIHVPREGHDRVNQALAKQKKDYISIHVPREGHDLRDKGVRNREQYISIHVPREGHDALSSAILSSLFIYFNPRAPRGARPWWWGFLPTSQAISIHVPREGHDIIVVCIKHWDEIISIHVPREGHDHLMSFNLFSSLLFQSTCPARGTTWTASAAPSLQ